MNTLNKKDLEIFVLGLINSSKSRDEVEKLTNNLNQMLDDEILTCSREEEEDIWEILEFLSMVGILGSNNQFFYAIEDFREFHQEMFK